MIRTFRRLSKSWLKTGEKWTRIRPFRDFILGKARNRPLRRGSSMSPHDRIIVDPDILVGKPVVKGTRLSVDFLLGLLAQGWSEAEILRNYPGLQREDLLACWAYASDVLREEKVYRYQVASHAGIGK